MAETVATNEYTTDIDGICKLADAWRERADHYADVLEAHRGEWPQSYVWAWVASLNELRDQQRFAELDLRFALQQAV